MSDVSMTSPSTRPGTATISRTRRCPDASEPRCTTRSTLAATVGTTKVVVNDCSCRRRPMISGLGALLGDTRQVGRGGFLPPRAGSLPSTTSCPRAVDAGAHGGVFSSTSLHEVAERAGGYSPAAPRRSTTASTGNTTRTVSSTARPTGRTSRTTRPSATSTRSPDALADPQDEQRLPPQGHERQPDPPVCEKARPAPLEVSRAA